MNIKNTLIVGIVFSTSFWSNAQDEKYIILDNKSIKKMNKEKKSELIVDNEKVFKFDPTRLVRGEIDFGFEKKIDENTSLEFDLGPTISNLKGFSVNHYFSGNSSYQERSSIGLFSSAALRFYPNNGVFNGFYVSPKIKYRLMNSQYIDETGVLPNTNASKNQFSFVFNMGTQTWKSENFSLDFYAGLGLGYDFVQDLKQTSVYDPITYTYTSSWKKQAYQDAKMIFNFGVKVGIGK